jgi:hypothetical protein
MFWGKYGKLSGRKVLVWMTRREAQGQDDWSWFISD